MRLLMATNRWVLRPCHQSSIKKVEGEFGDIIKLGRFLDLILEAKFISIDLR